MDGGVTGRVHDTLFDALTMHGALFARLPELEPVVAEAAEALVTSLRAGGKLLVCGNGGSAADAQHMAAEFVGRFLKERAPLPAIALSVNSSALTAIGNDYGFDEVFARQVVAHGRPGDVLVGISTSGNSPNVLRAVEEAKRIGIRTIGLAGTGGALAEATDVCLSVPSSHTPQIQEAHIFLIHLLCGIVEDALC